MTAERLAELIDRHADALVLYARPWCEAPEDIVQEAFVKLAAQRREPENPAAWLFRVVRNGAINAATAARRRRHHESRAASESPGWFEPSPEIDALDPGRVEAELRRLPEAQREVIVAHLWGGLSFEQIGRLVSRSSSGTHRLYHAGLNALRERLGVSCRQPDSRSTPTK